jgi:Protein of unknown function (DUF3995)
MALLAVGWCSVFAAAHVFWAVGGSAGLASSAGEDLAARRPAAFVVLGLWGVAGALLLAAVGIIVAGTRRRDSRRARAVAWAIGVIGAALLVRGIAVEVLLATDAAGIQDAVGPLETRWSLILWNPWFVLGGALFLATTTQIVRRARRGAAHGDGVASRGRGSGRSG